MFRELEHINCRPAPFECYTAHKLWTHEHTSEQMLRYHLDQEIDLSSRKGAFIDASVEWVSSCFGINSQSRIADFGCGPGLYTTRLAKYGGQVTGIDFSKRSIEYAREAARKEGLDIRYLDENYLSGEIHETFDLIIMIMCDFCALSPSQRSTMLHKSNMLLYCVQRKKFRSGTCLRNWQGKKRISWKSR